MTNTFNTFNTKLVEAGLTSELVERFNKNPLLAAKMMAVITADDAATFKVAVDCAKSVVDLVEDGKYSDTSYDWKSYAKSFPTTPTGSGDTVETDLFYLRLDHDASDEDVRIEAKRLGLRLATIHEILVFGTRYPEEQRKFPVITISKMYKGYYWHVLLGARWGREIDIGARTYCDSHRWNKGDCFLVARK